MMGTRQAAALAFLLLAQRAGGAPLRPAEVGVATGYALSAPLATKPRRGATAPIRPLLAPPPLLTFEGLSNANNNAAGLPLVTPPSPTIDVGPSHLVHAANLLFRVYDKTGTALTPPFRLGSLFTTLGGLCETSDSGDPVVLYDELADRWVLTQFAFASLSDPTHQCVAVSQTGDPTGAYHVYDFTLAAGYFHNRPLLGVWPDGYYLSAQLISGGGVTVAGNGATVFERAAMLTGDPGAQTIFFDLTSLGATVPIMLPSDLDGAAPPGGRPNTYATLVANELGFPQDAIRLFDFHADFDVPANSTFSERSESPVAVAALDPTSPVGRDDVPQPPPAVATMNLDAGQALSYRLQYRNFGTHESLVTNHTVDADATAGYHAAIHHFELRRALPAGTFAVQEEGTYEPDTNHRFSGSAAVDGQGNLAVAFTVSGPATFPSIRYAGRLAGDPPNGLAQGETTLFAGSGSQTNTASRWGDYTSLVVDPVNQCDFWYAGEYYPASSMGGWQTRIGTFRFPSCGPSGSTTTTTLPAGGCATAADCDDTDACTVDACTGGACSNTLPTCDSVLCALEAAAAAPCGLETVQPKAARKLARRFTKARKPIAKLCTGATGTKAERLRRKADTKLAGLAASGAKLGDGGGITPACAAALGELAARLRAAVAALGG